MNKYIFLLLLCIGCAESPTVKYRAKLVMPNGEVYKTVEFSTEKPVYFFSTQNGQRLGQWNKTYIGAPIGWLIEYERTE
jgi:hypothetical protein